MGAVVSAFCWCLCCGTAVAVAAALCAALALRLVTARRRAARWASTIGHGGRRERRVIGFFHPYSTGGGGGERVLWTMLAGMQRDHPDDDFVLYTHWVRGGEMDAAAVAELISTKFGLSLQRPVDIVRLRGIQWVEASSYPRLTLLLQSLGALPLAYEALRARPPDVWIDSMGYAMTYPLARWGCGCRVACYTHYPTVSTDMFAAVSSRRAAHNNAAWVARSAAATRAKLLYYRAFAELYGWAGRRADTVMVNSSWTRGHITQIWRLPEARVHRVFPPCDCAALFALTAERETDVVVSVAQFRPEKDHAMQLRALALLRSRHPEAARGVSLHLVGGVRDDGDRGRVAALRQLATELGIAEAVHFRIDLPYDDLRQLLGRAVAGLHTMWNEHFGIGVVEYMAAGCIPIAHNSGGPLMDIVGAGCGLLADTDDRYCDALHKVLTMTEAERAAMRAAGRERAARFSEASFCAGVRAACAGVLGHGAG